MRKRYLRKAYTVEAEQWTGHNLNDDNSLFQDSRVLIRHDGREFIVSTGAGIKVGLQRDWILKFEDDSLAIVSEENFKIKYEPVIEHTTFDPAKGDNEPTRDS